MENQPRICAADSSCIIVPDSITFPDRVKFWEKFFEEKTIIVKGSTETGIAHTGVVEKSKATKGIENINIDEQLITAKAESKNAYPPSHKGLKTLEKICMRVPGVIADQDDFKNNVKHHVEKKSDY